MGIAGILTPISVKASIQHQRISVFILPKQASLVRSECNLLGYTESMSAPSEEKIVLLCKQVITNEVNHHLVRIMRSGPLYSLNN